MSICRVLFLLKTEQKTNRQEDKKPVTPVLSALADKKKKLARIGEKSSGFFLPRDPGHGYSQVLKDLLTSPLSPLSGAMC